MCPVGADLYWKDSARLADGREIIYYDESPGLGRAKAPDRRPLRYRAADPGTGEAEDRSPSGLRWDALAGEWVIIAAQRQDRRSEEHTSELQSRQYLVCRLLLEKKKKK